jgi:hypothetical protein
MYVLREGWRKLLHNLFSSPNVIQVIKLKRISWARHVARVTDQKCLWTFGRKFWRDENQFGEAESEADIQTDIRGRECDDVDWMQLPHDRVQWRSLVDTLMDLRVPWNEGNFLTSWRPINNISDISFWGSHPVSYPLGTRGSSSGNKAAGTWS